MGCFKFLEKPFAVALLSCVLGSPAFAESIMVEDCGFESWNNDANLPAGPKNRWSLLSTPAAGAFGRVIGDARSGECAMRFRAATANTAGRGLTLTFSKVDLARARGNTVRASCWIRQPSAPKDGEGGRVTLLCSTSDNKKLVKGAGPESDGETDWGEYVVSSDIPDNAESVSVTLECGALAEAVFDDLKVEIVKKPTIRRAARKPAKDENSRYYLFKDDNSPGWKRTSAGGLIIERSELSAFDGSAGLRLRAGPGAAAPCASGLTNDFLNRRLDCSKNFANASLGMTVRGGTKFQVGLTGGGVTNFTDVEEKHVVDSPQEGWVSLRIPLGSFDGGGLDFSKIMAVFLRFPEGLPQGKIVDVDNLHIVFEDASSVRRADFALPREAAELLEGKGGPDDPASRPETRKGAFLVGGRPVFMLGPSANSPETFASSLGSMRLASVSNTPALLANGLPVSQSDIDDMAACSKGVRAMNGLPFVVGADGLARLSRLVGDGFLPQSCGRSDNDCRQSLPLCLEEQAARKLCLDYFQQSARLVLAGSGNPYAYELFSAPSYNCSCDKSRRMFLEFLRRKFGTPGEANKAMGTSFLSLEDAADTPVLERNPGLWAQWCEFSSGRFLEMLAEFSDAVRKADRRDRVRMTGRLSASAIFDRPGAVADLRGVSGALDVVGISGGFSFGRSTPDTVSSNLEHLFLADLAEALAKGAKPVVNLTLSLGRASETGRSQPRNEDIVAGLWAELAHGVSGAYMPGDNVEKALGEFKAESGMVGGVLTGLRRPRSALVFSQSSLRMSFSNGVDIRRRIVECYAGMLFGRYPFEILIEEDLPGAALSKYEMIVFPSIEFAREKTLPAVKKYVSNGGRIFCLDQAFMFDDNGRKTTDSALFGLERSPSPRTGRTSMSFPSGVLEMTSRVATKIVTAKCVQVANANNDCGLFLNKFGKGSVYYLSGDCESGFSDFLSHVMRTAGVSRIFDASSAEGAPLGRLECQLAELAGGSKLLYFMNWEDKGARLVECKINLPPGLGMSFFMHDPFDKELYAGVDGRTSWSAEDLANGVLLSLPAQTRKVLILSSSDPRNLRLTTMRPRDISRKHKELRERESSAAVPARSPKELKGLRVDSTGVSDTGASIPRPAAPHAAKDVQKKKAGPPAPFSPGVQVCARTPFLVSSGDAGRFAFVLFRPHRNWLASGLTGIPVGRRADIMEFLHAVDSSTTAWKKAPPRYEAVYEDGSRAALAVVQKEFLPGFAGAWPGKRDCLRIGLTSVRVVNPFPDRKIVSIDVLASKKRAVPELVGVMAGTVR